MRVISTSQGFFQIADDCLPIELWQTAKDAASWAKRACPREVMLENSTAPKIWGDARRRKGAERI